MVGGSEGSEPDRQLNLLTNYNKNWLLTLQKCNFVILKVKLLFNCGCVLIHSRPEQRPVHYSSYHMLFDLLAIQMFRMKIASPLPAPAKNTQPTVKVCWACFSHSQGLKHYDEAVMSLIESSVRLEEVRRQTATSRASVNVSHIKSLLRLFMSS